MSEHGGWAAPGGRPEPDAGATPPPAAGRPAPDAPGAPPPAWSAAPGGGWSQPPRPGVVPLRPLAVGEILDGAVAYVRRHPRPTLGIASVAALVLLAVQALVLAVELPSFSLEETAVEAGGTDTGTSDVTLNLLTLVQTVVGQAVTVVATGLLTFVMGQAVLGRDVTTAQAWARVRPRFAALLGLGLLSLVAIVLAILLPFVPGVVLLLVDQVALGVVLLLVGLPTALVLGVWTWLVLSLAPSVLVLEHVGVGASLRRARALLRGGFWRTSGVLLLAAFIVSVVGTLVGMLLGAVGGVAGALVSGADAALVAGVGGLAVGAAVAAVVTVPFDAGVRSLLYVDRRMRLEGFDLTLAAAVPGGPAGSAPPPVPPGEQRW